MKELDVEHGGLWMRELRAHGIDPADVLDFSVSINPYGPSEAVARAARGASLERYPDPDCLASRSALARELDVDVAKVVVGHGATELLWSLTSALCLSHDKPPRVVISEPAFGEVRAACRALRVQAISVRAWNERGPRPDLATLAAAANESSFVYLCNPSTPDGAVLPIERIEVLARALSGGVLVLDESFLSLSDHFGDAAEPLPPNVIRVRSLTKDHAVPGVRIGYAIAPAHVVGAVSQSRPPWTVSAAAQAVAACALSQRAFVDDSRRRLRADRQALHEALADLGIAPFPSAAPYLAFRCKHASGLRQRLLTRHRVLVRDCASFGLPDVVRVGVRGASDRTRLLAALAAEL